jgi:hypothetical protein
LIITLDDTQFEVSPSLIIIAIYFIKQRFQSSEEVLFIDNMITGKFSRLKFLVERLQNLFICPSCGHQTNADRNGSINIAARLITLTGSLHSVKGMGKWDSAVQRARSSRPKTWGQKSSRTSQLPLESPLSGSRESAAVHSAQTSLLDFGDRVRQSDHDPAVAKTVEDLSASGADSSKSMQEKKTWTVGGIQSE